MAELSSREPYFDNRKGEVTELRAALKNIDVQRDKVKYRTAVQKVIGYMTLGLDVSSLFSEMMMASATTDLVQKKLVYLYIREQAESNKDIAILMISTLTKDAMDDNPMIRGLALRTMCELRLPGLLEYIKKPLLEGLKDRSAYVRKIAAMGTVKIFQFAPDIIKDPGILEQLRGLIKDDDGQVFFNAIFALEEVLADEEGIQLDRDTVQTIVHRLHTVNEWSQCLLLSILTRYNPASQEEVIALLNSLDDRLKHANKGVVMAAAKLFLIFTKDTLFLRNDVYNRLRAPLISVVSSSSPELSFTALPSLLMVFKERTHLLSKQFKSFYIRESDPGYLKNLKLVTLTEVVTESNMESILSELRYCAMDPDASVAEMGIKCIGKIGKYHLLASNKSLELLIGLLESNLDHVTAYVFDAIKEILSKMKIHGNNIAAKMISYWVKATDHQSGKAALIWILGEFGEGISNSPYILEKLLENMDQENSAEVKLALLNAGVRLFFQRPPEFQHVLGRIFSHLVEDETNIDVRDRAMFYYRCLKTDVNKAQELLSKGRRMMEDCHAKQTLFDIEEGIMLKDLNTLGSSRLIAY